MNIKLTKPYKIVPQKVKRYGTHYNVPADQSLVVPMKALGEEVACDIRWEDENGELHLVENRVFVAENLVPVDPLLDPKLHELWEHYYDAK